MTRAHRSSSLSRRRFLGNSLVLAGTVELQRAARALGFAAAAEVCALNAEQEVGPYYVADELLRSAISEGKPGIPLSLRLAILDARTCKPLPAAAVDIWHCDALGLYSGYTAQNPTGPGGPGGPGGPSLGFDPQHAGPPPGFDPSHPGNRPGPPEGFGPPPENHPTDKLTFLRGIQITGPDGSVHFQTVFPGFYMGRTNHIHFKVRLGGHTGHRSAQPGQTYAAGHTAHTGQVFFPEELAVELMQAEPYRNHHIHRTTQAEDGVFNGQHGGPSIARLQPTASGIGGGRAFHAELIASVDPTATPGPVRPMGFPGGPPPPGMAR